MALLVTLGGPVAYSVQTATRSTGGAIPSAGPVAASEVSGRPGGLRVVGPDGGGRPPRGVPELTVGGMRGGDVGDELKAKLSADTDGYRWAAATVGGSPAAALQLATGEPVMALGGFNGTDPTPTLAEFERLVAAGEVRYFVGDAGGLGRGGDNDQLAAVRDWVAANYTATTVDGRQVYDLDDPR